MWTAENRARYDRTKLRYPSDLTEAEWALIAPPIPPAKCCGNKRTVDVCAVVDAILYILSTGCHWAVLPKELLARSTVDDYVRRRDHDGTLDRLHHALYVQCRELGASRSEIAWAGREASLTAAISDSQSVRSAEKGGAASTRRALMRARRSGAGSATCSWTRKVC